MKLQLRIIHFWNTVTLSKMVKYVEGCPERNCG